MLLRGHKLLDLRDIALAHEYAKLLPVRTLWRNPIVGNNHRSNPHLHGLVQAHTAAAQAPGANGKLGLLQGIEKKFLLRKFPRPIVCEHLEVGCVANEEVFPLKAVLENLYPD